MLRVLLAAAAALCPLAVSAQEAPKRDDTIRVQVNISSFFPGPTGDGEEAAKVRDRARRSVYDMAGKECTLLEQTFAKTCKLEQVTVNVNRQSQVGTQEGYLAAGNFVMRATLK